MAQDRKRTVLVILLHSNSSNKHNRPCTTRSCIITTCFCNSMAWQRHLCHTVLLPMRLKSNPPRYSVNLFPLSLSLSPLPEISFSPCILSPYTEDDPECYVFVFEIGQEGTERSTQWDRVRTLNWDPRCQLAVTECSCLNLPPFYHCVCKWYMHCGNALFSVYLDESIRHLKMRLSELLGQVGHHYKNGAWLLIFKFLLS